jgi:hypothetical protein
MPEDQQSGNYEFLYKSRYYKVDIEVIFAHTRKYIGALHIVSGTEVCNGTLLEYGVWSLKFSDKR